MTPEGKTKSKINRLLDRYKPQLWRYMPVPGGYGKQALDYIGCIRGSFFSIEAKRLGGKPTEKQLATIADIEGAEGTVFVLDGSDEGMKELEEWLNTRSRPSY